MRKFRGDRGAEAVEFALIAPILILLVLGIAEFGRAYYVQSMVSAGARDGVRVMALQNNPEAAKDAARNGAAPLDIHNIIVSPTSCDAVPGEAAQTAQVTITYDFEFLSGLFGAGMTLSGKGTMRCNG